jgi:hypothetical protein
METVNQVEAGSELKNRIAKYIHGRGHVSFVELEQEFPEAKGDFEYGMPGHNLIIWPGLSEQFVVAIQELVREQRTFLWPATAFTYMLDGIGLRLPVAKTARHYTKPHWLPVVLHHQPLPEAKPRRLGTPKTKARSRK